jgi:TPR repeat protein
VVTGTKACTLKHLRVDLVINISKDRNMYSRILIVLILIIFIILIFFLLKNRYFVNESQNNTVIIDLSMLMYASTSKYIIPENELLQKKLDSLSGDTKASLEVSYHYVHGYKNYDDLIQWFTIGAENGVPEIQYALADRLIDFSDNDFDSKTRGIFWRWKAIKNGYEIKRKEIVLKKQSFTLDESQPPNDERFPDTYAQLSETELLTYKTGALQGSKKAAWLLGKYYDEITLDKDLAEYWYRIGAQNGSSECQYILGQIMLKRDNEYDQIRGRFWLNGSP